MTFIALHTETNENDGIILYQIKTTCYSKEDRLKPDM